MPISRVTTLTPVAPSKRSIGAASRNKAKTSSTTTPITPKTPPTTSQSSPEASRIIVAIAPGPAISGMAIGKTEGSSSSPASPDCSSRRAERRSKSMSKAVMNNKIPPEIRNAASEMPMKSKIA